MHVKTVSLLLTNNAEKVQTFITNLLVYRESNSSLSKSSKMCSS